MSLVKCFYLFDSIDGFRINFCLNFTLQNILLILSPETIEMD